ncbi:MAG: Gfo/Idh/MocA family oxidoreductase [Ancalomicrobiaceae bacterium]|nr:Gfo/Idh/MocA family oxidoreductase [Ancalomicrobiaceae bacterium]
MTIEASSTATARRRLRLGMVGGGRGAFIGAVHRIAARLDDRYELVAGALSSDPERALASADDLLIAPDRAYADFADMARMEAARPDCIDVVAIVTPNHLHFPAARAFLAAGIHVICDKPMTRTVAEAEALADLVEKSGLVFVLTHNYTAYPMVRQAKSMVADGVLGKLRLVQVEYPQDWLTTAVEATGSKQAEWRVDPARSGAGGSLGDIGSHAFNLAEYISGLKVETLAADLECFVPGRTLDDNANILMRFAGGAKGMLWCSQVAPGNANALKIRLYGEKGGLEWQQESPNTLLHTPFGEPPRLITRSGPGANAAAAHATRVPSGHPEGYLEGFAQVYADAAELISARLDKRAPDPAALGVPTVHDGVRGVRFIDAAVRSGRANAGWTIV